MIEYIFFHQKTYDLFCVFLQKNTIPFELSTEETDVEGLLVNIPDDLSEEITDSVEDYYDELMDMDEQMVFEESEEDYARAGLAVALSSGDTVFASVNPDVLNRMLSVVSKDEITEFIDAIVTTVENPDVDPFCKRWVTCLLNLTLRGG